MDPVSDSMSASLENFFLPVNDYYQLSVHSYRSFLNIKKEEVSY